MIARSLKWRLAIATALIIAAVVIASGVFSTVTVKRQFDQFLLEQRSVDLRGTVSLIRAMPKLEDALRLVHARSGHRTVVVDANDRVVLRYPPELNAYQIAVRGEDLTLHRVTEGRNETLLLRAKPVQLDDGRKVFLLPPRDGRNAPRAFRIRTSRVLLGGLVAAALLAVAVMITVFRRVFRPVEALTAGARSLASGKLETRVAIRGDDEVAELGRAFNSMAEALERNERARRNMVSDVAHELRTPLTSIRVQLEAAQDGVVEPDAKFLASLAEDAATLARLVDDLQQLSLADAGQLRLELADVEAADLVERALSGLARPGILITHDAEPGLVLRADARRIVQVVRNLLVNALAYARTSIHVSAARVDGGVEIRVMDDGPGVAEQHVERIFDRFYRADASRSRATGGAGLGLAIARQLVELHGGTIRYERPSFIVRLPS
ncbi:MAG TPA: ATP-binding protein [Thermoanaerobaculia bacterium]|nr:ATP-binding protein [Thermoanaerobaculia bacterium]